MKRSICSILAIFMASSALGCSSSTLIRASDPSARIYVDGEYRGQGSVLHQDTKTVGATTSVRLEKEGCTPHDFTFRRNEELDVGAAVGGLFLLVPFLWVMKYKPSRTYAYECSSRTVKTASTRTVADEKLPRSGAASKPSRAGADTRDAADTRAADTAQAAAAFDEGKALWLHGKVAEACEKFALSHQIVPDTGTLLLLADCHAKDGDLALAQIELEEAKRRAEHERRPDRVQYAADRLQALASGK